MEIFLAILFFSEKEKRRVYNVKSPPSVYLSSPSFLIVYYCYLDPGAGGSVLVFLMPWPQEMLTLARLGLRPRSAESRGFSSFWKV